MGVSIASILVVDDDELVREVVRDTLEDAGYDVVLAANGEEASALLQQRPVRLIVLDLGLPGIDGLTLTRTVKAALSEIGVIIISGRGETIEKIVGLEVGADDYLAKPFEARELLARVRSVLRRLPGPSAGNVPEADPGGAVYGFDGWQMDIAAHQLRDPEGQAVSLSTSEFALLQVFVTHPGQVLSRERLLDLIHSNDSPAFDRSIDIRVVRLRRKIEDDPKSPARIKTIRNGGYLFTPKVSRL